MTKCIWEITRLAYYSKICNLLEFVKRKKRKGDYLIITDTSQWCQRRTQPAEAATRVYVSVGVTEYEWREMVFETRRNHV